MFRHKAIEASAEDRREADGLATGRRLSPFKMRLNLAIGLYLIACISTSSFLIHSLWLQAASSNSVYLVRTLEFQIVDAVKKEITSRIANAESAYAAVRTIFLQRVIDPREADKREFVFLSQLQSQPALSAVAFGWPDAGFFTSHKLGDDHLEMMEIGPRDSVWTKRIDRYRRIPGDIEFQERHFERSDYRITAESWFRRAISSDRPAWFEIDSGPWSGRGRAVAYAGPIDIDLKRAGVLATVVEMSRLSRFLGALPVARSGAAYILSSEGKLVAGPDPEADELMAPRTGRMLLYNVIRQVMAGYSSSEPPVSMHANRYSVDGQIYDVNFAALGFFGWRAVIIIPEQEFLGSIQRTSSQLWYALGAIIVFFTTVSIVIGTRMFIRPLRRIMSHLAAVGNLQMTTVMRQPSPLYELDQLSGAVVRMSSGLDAFSKYVPLELVKTLVRQGIGAVRGGELKSMTVMFIDISGFTGISERMGADVVPLVNRYFEVVTTEVAACGGTIDKFIGDSVMAFWGAPRDTPHHAALACEAALKVMRAMDRHGIVDDIGQPLSVRIGINTGDCVVGNIGAQCHLNYTVIGDPVNVASRLEVSNKSYGTRIILGEATRLAAGEEFRVRELDHTSVSGRNDAVTMYELVSMATEPSPPWLESYNQALTLYRKGSWSAAEETFKKVLRWKGEDQATAFWIERCRRLSNGEASPTPA